MARVTIEDCVLQVPNRFDLVVLAARRSRDIASGVPLTIERDDDKNPIVALREIAGQNVSVDEISESVVQNFQRFVEVDDAEEAVVELGASQDRSLPNSSINAGESEPAEGQETAGLSQLPVVEATEAEISDPSATSVAE